MKIQIELECKLETGKVNLNEIVYRIDQLSEDIINQVITQVVLEYQRQVVERLAPGHGSRERAGLGRHKAKDGGGNPCRGRKVRRRGFREKPRCIKSKYGTLRIPLQVVECLTCGKRYSPLLDALDIEPYAGHEDMVEKAVMDAVIDTNYRRLIDGQGIDVSLGGVHNYIAGSDIASVMDTDMDLDDYCGVMGDGSGLKKSGGRKGEIRALVGITDKGGLEPLGSWVDESWEQIEKEMRARLKSRPKQPPLFLYDGEPGLDRFLEECVRGHQRCEWHGPRGLYHAMWEDGYRKKDIDPYQEKLRRVVGVSIPEEDYDKIDREAIEDVREKYEDAKTGMVELIDELEKKECPKAVAYLRNLVDGLFHQVELWMDTGIVAPKTTSRLERLFRELARRLKRIAWGWSDKVATNLSKMIMIKKYTREKWEEYWLEKMGVKGNFAIWINQVKVIGCHNI